jgi:hypothetical protein
VLPGSLQSDAFGSNADDMTLDLVERRLGEHELFPLEAWPMHEAQIAVLVSLSRPDCENLTPKDAELHGKAS